MNTLTEQKQSLSEAPGAEAVGETVDIARIMDAIPHRYPFLMIDRVIEMVRNVSAIGVRTFRSTRTSFRGIFPGTR